MMGNRTQRWAIALPLLISMVSGLGLAEEEIVDFSDQTTPTCELIGLVAARPGGWFSVPMQDLPAGMAGCQMMRTDEDEVLVGIIRLSANDTGNRTPGDESRNRQVAIEFEVLKAMGIVPGEPLWFRDEVPLSGSHSAGFSGAQAIGLSATIEESGLPQEVHILTFHGPSTQYTLLLITPPHASEPKTHQRNLADFAKLIQGLQASPEGS